MDHIRTISVDNHEQVASTTEDASTTEKYWKLLELSNLSIYANTMEYTQKCAQIHMNQDFLLYFLPTSYRHGRLVKTQFIDASPTEKQGKLLEL